MIATTGDLLGADALSVVDARSGSIVRTSSYAGQSISAIGVDETAGRALVLGCPNGGSDALHGAGVCTVFVVDTRSGAVLARTDVLATKYAYAQQVAVDTALHRAFVLAQPGVPGGNFPSPTGTARISVFDTRTGRLLHHIDTGLVLIGLAVDEKLGRVFALDSANHSVVAYDAARL